MRAQLGYSSIYELVRILPSAARSVARLAHPVLAPLVPFEVQVLLEGVGEALAVFVS